MDRPDKPGLRQNLYIIIFEAETLWGRRFDIALLWLIVFSVVVVIFDSDPSFPQVYHTVFLYLEYLITFFFTIEYLLRLWTTKHPWKYATSFYGIVDLISILPSYISFFLPQTHYLMVVRILRLLRVTRILKLFHLSEAAQVLGHALWAARYKISIFFSVVVSVVLIIGSLMHIIEGEFDGFESISKSMYWAIVTMTTVGYGDVIPTTSFGKVIASFMMLIGYAIIAVPTGIVSSELNMAIKHQNTHTCIKCFSDLEEQDNYCFKCGELNMKNEDSTKA